MVTNTGTHISYLLTMIVACCVSLLIGVYAIAQIPVSGQTYHSSRSDARSSQPLVQRNAGPGTRPSARRGENLSTELALTSDGWHTWTVDAVEDAPNWCCHTWRGKEVVNHSCDLDSDGHGMSTSSEQAVTREFQIFAQRTKGQTTSIRAYGANCSVVSEKTVTDHGKVDAGASLDWLSTQLSEDKHLTSSALAAIAVHEANQAQDLLQNAAQDSQPLSTRKQAIFWMGQVRARQSEDELVRLMQHDANDKVREHTVFSVSQSKLERKLDLIARVARADRVPNVRSQAWFWLAQTNEVRAGQYIVDGMQSESSEKVLEQAVFALSQLPGDEAVDRLIEVIEQSSYDRKLRKQALFWLAQDDSTRAVDYLANVLDR